MSCQSPALKREKHFSDDLKWSVKTQSGWNKDRSIPIGTDGCRSCSCRLVLQKVASEGYPKVCNHGEGPSFSWLKAATTAFTFKTLLRHYAKRALTPRSLNVKLGTQRNYHEGRAGWLAKCLIAVPHDNCESGSSRFQPGECPRGLLHDYEPSDGPSRSTSQHQPAARPSLPQAGDPLITERCMGTCPGVESPLSTINYYALHLYLFIIPSLSPPLNLQYWCYLITSFCISL